MRRTRIFQGLRPALALLAVAALALLAASIAEASGDHALGDEGTDTAPAASVGPLSGKTVCENFEPPLEGLCTVSDTGERRGPCAKCLVGDKWDQLRASLGTSAVRGLRATRPHLAANNWMSHAMLTTAFRIIAEELLGYEPVVFHSDWGIRLDEVLAPGCQAINLEVWHPEQVLAGLLEDRSEREQYRPKIASSKLGAQGLEALYATPYTPFTSRNYEALQSNLQLVKNGKIVYVMDEYPPDGTLTAANLSNWLGLELPHLGCIADTEAELGWNVSVCSNSRWTPPACQSEDPYDSSTCKEMYLATPYWSGGYFEAMIHNLKLNFSAVYTGPTGIPKLLAQHHAERKGMLYYWWEPDILHVQHPSVLLDTPAATGDCIFDPEQVDPVFSTTTCTDPPTEMAKFAHVDMAETDPDLDYLFRRFQFSNDDIFELMSYLSIGGGDYDTFEDATCAFLKETTSLDWQSWVSIKERCIGPAAEGYTWDSATQSCVRPKSPLMTYFISAAAFAFVLGLLAAVLIFRHLRLKNYVAVIESGVFKAHANDFTYETPIELTVGFLQRVHSTRRLTSDQRGHALRLAQTLLNASDLHTPMVTEYGHPSADPSSNHAKLLESMVEFITSRSKAHPEWMANAHRGALEPSQSFRRRQQLTSSDIDVMTMSNGSVTGTSSSPEDKEFVAEVLVRYNALINSLDPAFLEKLGRSLAQDSFQLLRAQDPRPLLVASLKVLEQLGLMKCFGARRSGLIRFLLRVEDGYRNNPYHNACHAADVVSRLSAILTADNICMDGSYKSNAILMSTVLAAIIHDYDHPGTDNDFQVQEDTLPSRMYNHQMVLENSSIFQCLELLRDPAMDVIGDAGFNRATVMDLIIKLVLATDMAGHFIQLGDFNAKVVTAFEEKNGSLGGGVMGRASLEAKRDSKEMARRRNAMTTRPPAVIFNGLDENLQTLVLSMALKIADIGHSMTTLELHVQWAKRLEKEFFDQGAAELRAGRPAGFLKHPERPGSFDPSNQVAFFSIIVMPTVKAWSRIFPASGHELHHMATTNMTMWRQAESETGVDKPPVEEV